MYMKLIAGSSGYCCVSAAVARSRVELALPLDDGVDPAFAVVPGNAR